MNENCVIFCRLILENVNLALHELEFNIGFIII